MMRCPDECGKKWRTGRQMKPGWKKQEERKEKTNDRRKKNNSENSGRKEE